MLEKQKNQKIRLLIVAVILLLIFLHYLGSLNFIERYFVNYIIEVQGNTYSFLSKLKYSFINYEEAQNYKKENEQLKIQINELIYSNSQLQQYQVENEKLRSILGFLEQNQAQVNMASVIGRDLVRPNTLIINKGSKDGVKPGQAVVVDNGIIIAKVIEVKNNISTVLLLTDKLSQLAVSTLTVSKSTGLAEGEYGLSIIVRYIPQDVEVKENDLIITSGVETNIPRGLVIGKVNRVISHDNDLFKSVTITPLVDYSQVSFVGLIIPKQYNNE